MHTTNECLAAAMLMASESYSVSSYEMSDCKSMEQMCDDRFVFAFEADDMAQPALAA